jgi:hypothetical protein
LLRNPFTFNSKCIKQRKDAGVKIIQRFELSNIPQIKIPLLREFRLYIAYKDIENKSDVIKQQNTTSSQQSVRGSKEQSYQWIETLLKTPLGDQRKFCLWKILIPYLLNVRKLNENEIIVILLGWLNACNDLKQLYFEPSKRIKYDIENAKSYLPLSKTKIKEENIELYDNVIGKNQGNVDL